MSCFLLQEKQASKMFPIPSEVYINQQFKCHFVVILAVLKKIQRLMKKMRENLN